MVANKALCQTLETGLNVDELTRLTLFKEFSTPLLIRNDSSSLPMGGGMS